MFSNGCGLPPKDPVEVQNHYENLLKALDIPLNISAEDQLAILRSLPSSDIVAGVGVIPENSFRAVTDGYFVRKSLFDELRNGSFARVLLRRGIRIMIGECRDEINSYRLTSPPAKLSHLESRLAVEYPKALARVIADRNVPGGKLPCYAATVQDLWGKVYSDLQVHTSERGFITALSEVLPVENIFRYRVEFVTERMSEAHGLAMGVCHG
jgi:carboxylesterase type B